jgi:excisionase family DNA binding protein
MSENPRPPVSSLSDGFPAETMRARGSDRLLDEREVAELLHVPARWVRTAGREGKLPSVQIGRYRRYDLADVLAWVEQQKTGGAPMTFRKHVPEVPGGGTK